MKRLAATLLTLLMAAAPIVASPAGSNKLLQNLKGRVTYGAGAPSKALPHDAQIALNDSDFAATGPNSEATITLPDSSKVTMASNSNVQLVSFDQTGIATARFVVIGKVRFAVEHPAGARANYTFQTSTGQIAVRGTVGDIFANTNGLQVNVYELSNPKLPVRVRLNNGQVFTLSAGQSLVATAIAGAITASVSGLSQSLFTPFSELGAPANASSLGISATSSAAASSAAATTAAAGGTASVSAAAAAAVVGGAAAATTVISNSNATPSKTQPAPQPSTTSVPITVQNLPASPAPPPPGPPAPNPPLPGPPHGQGPPRPHIPGGRPSPRP